jgi:5-methylcytosine-specific restriction endonuclease McrA
MVLRHLKRLMPHSTSRSSADGLHGIKAKKRLARTEERRRSTAARPAPREPLLAAWVRMRVWWRDQGKCVRCGSREKLWFDYIIPVSRGGGNAEDNIRLLCEGCKHHSSWRREVGS